MVVWIRVSCTTTVQNYTLSTSATLYRWLFGAVLVALPLLKTMHYPHARHYAGRCLEPCLLHYHCSKLYTLYKRDILQVVVWSRVSCTTTVQNYTLSTSATLYMWFFWSRVSCTTTVQNCTPSASGTLYRWLFGAVLVALPLFKTIHCPQARHYTGGCLEPC